MLKPVNYNWQKQNFLIIIITSKKKKVFLPNQKSCIIGNYYSYISSQFQQSFYSNFIQQRSDSQYF